MRVELKQSSSSKEVQAKELKQRRSLKEHKSKHLEGIHFERKESQPCPVGACYIYLIHAAYYSFQNGSLHVRLRPDQIAGLGTLEDVYTVTVRPKLPPPASGLDLSSVHRNARW